ncbi:MerR family transcriptional regulator [Alteribacillus bidgolensis]|uniref:Transcriptional regulator, MerR family n=1 Tax=Alteribacillus bidgolensis TaxID=930129 RepID=A0A1G8RC30_9BACI|nr:MerR family transcriptional regulator [Alteribacillus bidgolensis]SDJ14085.1 transcriptional regulator, MerR family [Alteribacillus bidgolensis]
MYSIGEVSNLTGITTYTLRYYEKIGVLPNPNRQDGKRRYSDHDLRFIRFIHGLKQTGMNLEDIAAFTKDGCLLNLDDQDIDTNATIQNRINMLAQHIDQLEHQIKQLEAIKEIAQEKSDFYLAMLKEQTFKAHD